MGGNSLKLSIIITYYNLDKYIGELLAVLMPQIRDGVEVILIDDASNKPFENQYDQLKVIRLEENQGVSHARNTGLKAAAGEYISIIDGDDVVAKDFVDQVLERIGGNPDYIELSWRALDIDDIRFHNKATATAKLANPSACTRVFKHEFIGEIRFNEKKDSAEDEDFIRRLKLSRGKRAYIEKWMYFYRVDRENSTSMRFRQGLSKTKKIIYHYKHVTEDMTDLIEEIKREDESNEVFLFTSRCDIPELSEHCRIRRPYPTWADELRGEPCSYIKVRERPVKTQVVIYSSTLPGTDGISTWVRNFCRWMCDWYDITVVYGSAPENYLKELRPIVRVIRSAKGRTISCNTVLMMRIADALPANVHAEKIVQVVHTVNDGYKHLPVRDDYIYVSHTSKKSFGKDGTVIYNLPGGLIKQGLILVSTCRIDASDKGNQNERMIKLAKMLRAEGIPFLWFYFSKTSLSSDPDMIRIEPVQDVRPFLQMADYLVQLSDSEAYCYSITEAMEQCVPVITTPLEVLEEIGYSDGVDGYTVPFNMDFDVRKLLHFKKLKPGRLQSVQDAVVDWKEFLGEMAAVEAYKPEIKQQCEVIKPYFDMELQKDMKPGEHADMWRERAETLKNMGLIKIM
jgi:glycosyltransferase involved in cell wall biosynthesis